MQKQYNELEILIGEAFRKGSPAYLAPILSIIYSKMDVRSCFLQKNDIEKLNRLSYKADSVATYYIVGLTYDLILSSKILDIETISSDVLLAMANSLLPVLENIKGTTLSYRIIQYIQILFYVILERKQVPEEEQALIDNLMQSENLKFGRVFFNFEENEEVKEIMRLSKSKTVQDKTAAVKKLMDLLAQCSSFEEQIEIFAKKTIEIMKYVVNGTNETYMELFEVLGAFLETMLFQFQHNVLFEKRLFDSEASLEKFPSAFISLSSDQSKKKLNVNEVLESINREFSPRSVPRLVVQYFLAEQVRMIRETEGVYTLAIFILNIFILYTKHIELQMISIRVLERLFYHFPGHRKQLEELILSALSRISAETSEEMRKPAAIFLYKLVHRDASPSFKAELEKRESIKALFSSKHYNSSALTVERNEAEITDFQDLQIRAGSPLSRTIEAGLLRSENIEIWQPYSILTFNFSVLQRDLTFTVERIARFKNILNHEKDEPYVIVKNGKIDSSKNPLRGSILIKEPGIYRLDFDNKSSWFNSKTIRYRVLVLSPNFEDSFELKPKLGLIYENTLGPIHLPSAILSAENQAALNSSRENTRINTSTSGGATPSSARLNTSMAANSMVGMNTSMTMQQKPAGNVEALIYLNPKAVEFSVVSFDKEFEIIINYDPEGQIDWERVNTRILNVIEKVLDVNNEREERKIKMQLVYDESVMEKQLTQDRFDDKFTSAVEEYFSKNLFLLNKVRRLLLNSNIQIITEIEYQVQRILRDNIKFGDKATVLLVIEHETQGIHCKFKKEAHAIDINIEDYAIPFSLAKQKEEGAAEEGEQEEVVELLPAEVLFFQEGQSAQKRLGYLAFLIHFIFCSSNRSIQDYLIFEDMPVLFDQKSSNRAVLKEIIDSFYNKIKLRDPEEQAIDPSQYDFKLHFSDENKHTNIKLTEN